MILNTFESERLSFGRWNDRESSERVTDPSLPKLEKTTRETPRYLVQNEQLNRYCEQTWRALCAHARNLSLSLWLGARRETARRRVSRGSQSHRVSLSRGPFRRGA